MSCSCSVTAKSLPANSAIIGVTGFVTLRHLGEYHLWPRLQCQVPNLLLRAAARVWPLVTWSRRWRATKATDQLGDLIRYASPGKKS
jgi:hypothetical protein